MIRRIRIGLVGLLWAGILSGCQPAGTPGGQLAPQATITATQPALMLKETVVPAAPAMPTEETQMNVVPIPTPLDASMQEIVTQARDDLARRLSIDPAKIELVEASEVTWPDGSLGCPQPGMLYTQVTVDGLRLRFSVGGRIYSYHSGGGRPPFWCEKEP